jgi:hypothetical protein
VSIGAGVVVSIGAGAGVVVSIGAGAGVVASVAGAGVVSVVLFWQDASIRVAKSANVRGA